MTKIKVIVRNTNQANELIEYWNDKNVSLSIEVKENTVGQDDVIDLMNSNFSFAFQTNDKIIQIFKFEDSIGTTEIDEKGISIQNYSFNDIKLLELSSVSFNSSL